MRGGSFAWGQEAAAAVFLEQSPAGLWPAPTRPAPTRPGRAPRHSHRQSAAKKLDRRLATLGAAPLLERGLGDDQVGGAAPGACRPPQT
jgi:hypothetical protein